MLEGGGSGSVRGVVGRHRERALLGQVLENVRAQRRGDAVLLRGEAGIGKTALLDWTAAQAAASGFPVLRAVGSEAEQGQAFGALHQILWPLLQSDAGVRPEYEDPLLRALGLREGTAPGGLAAGAATLGLLADAARERPLVIVLDDLQWADSSSTAVFAFLQRRIAEVPVVMVGAIRGDDVGTGQHDGWPATPVDVTSLTADEALALLRLRHPALAAGTATRVMDEADGNPLALVELPLQLDDAHRKGVKPLPEPLPLGSRLERLFTDRLALLTGQARWILLLSALSGSPVSGRVGSWLGRLPAQAAESALDEIGASGLARLDPSGALAFRHPLVRSAVIGMAGAHERREAHRALADALEPQDPRRLLHEASAALLPDETLAGRLAEAGRRTAARGADAEGALLLERAAALSADPAQRARRLTWAAVMAARGGCLPSTAQLVEELKRGTIPEDIAPLFDYAVVYVDQSHHIDFESSFTRLPEVLRALARPGAESFGGLAEQAYFKLLLATSLTGDPRGLKALDDHRDDMPPLADLCLRAWADPARTAHGVAGELRALVDAMSDEQQAGGGWLALWTATAVDAADADLRRRFSGQHSYATQGSLAKAACHHDFLLGNWDTADVCLREATAAAELGYHNNALLFRLYHAHYLAGRGAERELLALQDEVRPIARRARMRFVLDAFTRLRGLAALAHGRHEEAYAHLAELTPPGVLPSGLPWFHTVFFDFVTAAVHTGRLAEARVHVEAARAVRMADISGHHAFLFAAAEALTASDDSADASFRAACAVPDSAQWAFDLARLRLAHGSWLRRRHRAEARDVLREAHHTFRRLGADPWRETAEEELRAAGDPVGSPRSADGLLTAQETRIAALAATGLTNKEIGQRLRLSPRTVSAHLYRIFPKLGITSRAALAQALKGGS